MNVLSGLITVMPMLAAETTLDHLVVNVKMAFKVMVLPVSM